MWLSSFFENALVRRVKRRIDIRIVRLFRSTNDVQMCDSSRLPMTVTSVLTTSGGL